MLIRPNVKQHTTLNYYDDPSNIKSVSITGKNMQLSNLNSNMTYIVYTSDGTSESKKAMAKTLEYSSEKYDKLIMLVTVNKNLLFYKNSLADYIALIRSAEEQQSVYGKELDPIDAIMYLKYSNKKAMDSKKATDFSTIDAYNAIS